MVQEDQLFGRLNQRYSTLSKGQKRLADFIADHYDQAVFMTAAKLAEQAGVSESTAVRFAVQLGYGGFPEFHKALEDLVARQLREKKKNDVIYGQIPESQILDTVLKADMDKIRVTLEQTDREAFQLAVETILQAETIYVLGVRNCAPLAGFLSFYLHQIFPRVFQVSTNSASELLEQMIRISEKDVLIGISFPRYSMRTLKAMEFANNRNAKVIAVTDSIHSPMNLYSSCNLIAKSDLTSVVDSLTAPMSVLNALIVALCARRQEKVKSTLETLEAVWDEYQVYGSDEMNYLDDRLKLYLRKPGEMYD